MPLSRLLPLVTPLARASVAPRVSALGPHIPASRAQEGAQPRSALPCTTAACADSHAVARHVNAARGWRQPRSASLRSPAATRGQRPAILARARPIPNRGRARLRREVPTGEALRVRPPGLRAPLRGALRAQRLHPRESLAATTLIKHAPPLGRLPPPPQLEAQTDELPRGDIHPVKTGWGETNHK